MANCLESVRRIFDEIVIVDTASTDRTVEIARSFGANVFDFVWVDSFSAARNEALSHATGDFAFWLDADYVAEPGEREKLHEPLERLRAGDPAAYSARNKPRSMSEFPIASISLGERKASTHSVSSRALTNSFAPGL